MPAADHELPFMELNLMNRRGGGGPDDGGNRWPPWLQPLLSTRFFAQCDLHADSHKSECNMYCLDCMNGAICSLCLADHRDHHAIQISNFSISCTDPRHWGIAQKCILAKFFRRLIEIADKEIVVPRRDQGERDSEGARHRGRADVRHRQRPCSLPKRAPPNEARQGRHQHLRGLRPQPPRLLPILLSRLQDGRRGRRIQQEERNNEKGRQEQEEEQEEGGGGVRLGGPVHEQCDAGIHAAHSAANRRQLPWRQEEEGRSPQSTLWEPYGRNSCCSSGQVMVTAISSIVRFFRWSSANVEH